MAFVNEFIAEADIQKYALDDLKREFDPWGWRKGRPSVFRHSWTIDRDQDAFLISASVISEVGASGRGEPTRKQIFILSIHEKQIRLVLDRVPPSSVSMSDNPFLVVWNLIEVQGSSDLNIPSHRLVEILKDALTTYGSYGAFQQVPNTLVQFLF